MSQKTVVSIKYNKFLLAVKQFEKFLLNEKEIQLIAQKDPILPHLPVFVKAKSALEGHVKTVHVFEVEGIVADGSKELNAIKGVIIDTLDKEVNGQEYYVEEIKLEVITTERTLATLP